MRHEWDWPARRRYYPPRRRRYYRTIDAYQPGGWNSPIAKKIVRIYWRVTITMIKMLIAIPLAILAIASFWLAWIELQVIYTIVSHRLLG
jgi:hypothetical protein